jgi:hypothetical protein
MLGLRNSESCFALPENPASVKLIIMSACQNIAGVLYLLVICVVDPFSFLVFILKASSWGERNWLFLGLASCENFAAMLLCCCWSGREINYLGSWLMIKVCRCDSSWWMLMYERTLQLNFKGSSAQPPCRILHPWEGNWWRQCNSLERWCHFIFSVVEPC